MRVNAPPHRLDRATARTCPDRGARARNGRADTRDWTDAWRSREPGETLGGREPERWEHGGGGPPARLRGVQDTAGSDSSSSAGEARDASGNTPMSSSTCCTR